MRLEGESWQAYFRDFARCAFRLELLPQYLVEPERESFAAFRAHGGPPPDGFNADWHEALRAAKNAGKTIQRVHAVTPPLTDYLRYELGWAYPGNVAAGEDIRILDLSTTPDPGLPGFDFWMFDDAAIVAMLYEPDGTQIGRELLEDADPSGFVRIRDRALAAAVAFADYRADAART